MGKGLIEPPAPPYQIQTLYWVYSSSTRTLLITNRTKLEEPSGSHKDGHQRRPDCDMFIKCLRNGMTNIGDGVECHAKLYHTNVRNARRLYQYPRQGSSSVTSHPHRRPDDCALIPSTTPCAFSTCMYSHWGNAPMPRLAPASPPAARISISIDGVQTC
jgi:hypothetical protein